MTINKKLIKLLRESNISNEDTALLYLMGIFFNLDTSSFDSNIKKQVNLLNIVERDFIMKTVNWKIPLFENQETKWEWVGQYRQLFRDKQTDKGGALKSCINKMKKFFSENPDARRKDVMQATKMYVDKFGITENPKFMRRADYFIYKGVGADRTSELEQYIEMVQEKREKTDHNTKSM